MKIKCLYVGTELFSLEIDYLVSGKMERKNFQNPLPFNCQFTVIVIKYLLEVSLKCFLFPQFFFPSIQQAMLMFFEQTQIQIEIKISIPLFP